MSEISSGLVAVAWIAPDEDRFRVRICEDRPTDAQLWSPMCWVSDAEAIIAEKDAEIEGWKFDLADALDMKAGKGPTVLNWQAERIKELEAHTTTLEEVIASQRENVTSLATEVVDKDAEIERLKQTPTIEEAKTTVEHLRAYASDNGYSHGDYADVMTEAANQIEKQSERIKELEAEVLEQCRLNGMGAEREATLLGKVERQSAALKLAREALASVITSELKPTFGTIAIWCVEEALAAIDALKGE